MFPDLCIYLKKEISSFCGWMNSSAEAFRMEYPDIRLAVVTPDANISNWTRYEINGIIYYLIPCKSHVSFSQRLVNDMKVIIQDFMPDIIHINGVEHCIGLAVLNATNNIPIVASIQGLAHVYQKYIDGRLDYRQMIRYTSLRDIFGESGMRCQRRLMRQRGRLEIEQLSRLKYIIGRTDWDKSHCIAVNQRIKYFHCEENLRKVFYHHKWRYNECTKYNIFVSNGATALKGVHSVIQALPIVLREFPDTQLTIAGVDYRRSDRIKDRLRITGYQKYLIDMMKKFNIEDRVRFLGWLDENEMCNAFLNANVYVLPSCIENSPNSLGEAQILGVPAIASFVGGVPSMVSHGITGLMYRYEEYEMLARCIITLFKNTDCELLSIKEREAALRRHDWKTNATALNDIYYKIMLAE